MDAINILYSRIFFLLGLHLLHQDGVPEKVSSFTAPGVKVKSTIHNDRSVPHQPVFNC